MIIDNEFDRDERKQKGDRREVMKLDILSSLQFNPPLFCSCKLSKVDVSGIVCRKTDTHTHAGRL